MVELNYPIKYGLMAMPMVTGRDALGYKTYDVKAYVPMPCYLVNEIKHYNEDGTTEMYYEVVFTKNNMDLFSKNNDQTPKLYWEKIQCDNSEILEIVFDDYESAKEKGKEENEKLVGERTCFTPPETYQERIEKEMGEIEACYRHVEQELFSETPKIYKKSKQKVQ